MFLALLRLCDYSKSTVTDLQVLQAPQGCMLWILAKQENTTVLHCMSSWLTEEISSDWGSSTLHLLSCITFDGRCIGLLQTPALAQSSVLESEIRAIALAHGTVALRQALRKFAELLYAQGRPCQGLRWLASFACRLKGALSVLSPNSRDAVLLCPTALQVDRRLHSCFVFVT